MTRSHRPGSLCRTEVADGGTEDRGGGGRAGELVSIGEVRRDAEGEAQRERRAIAAGVEDQPVSGATRPRLVEPSHDRHARKSVLTLSPAVRVFVVVAPLDIRGSFDALAGADTIAVAKP